MRISQSSVGDGECIRDLMWASLRSQEVPHVRHIHAKVVDCALLVLLLATAPLRIRNPVVKAHGTNRRRGGASRVGGLVVDSAPLQLRLLVSVAEVSSEPAEDGGAGVGFVGGFSDTRGD